MVNTYRKTGWTHYAYREASCLPRRMLIMGIHETRILATGDNKQQEHRHGKKNVQNPFHGLNIPYQKPGLSNCV